jgi:environmental stress-induced protein Ves
MGPEIKRWADRLPTPWKNGAGTTYPLLAAPAGAEAEQADWRLSIADIVVDGAFSTFAGIERLSVVLSGPGISLMVDSIEHRLDRSELGPSGVLAYPGEAVVTCRLLGGPVKLLNVMLRRPHCRADLSLLEIAQDIVVVANPNCEELILVVAGPLRAAGLAQQSPAALQQFDLLRVGQGGRVELSGPGMAVRLTISCS